MGQDFFKYLPPEIIVDILLRLPVRTTIRCKCVCKSWLYLVETPEFAKSHISKSAPGLAVFQGSRRSSPYNFFEYVDDHRPKTKHQHNVVFNFGLPHFKPMHSSVDGLLLLYDHKIMPHDLLICNPITRDYIKIPCPQEISSYNHQVQLDTFGFGVCKTSGLYKLVRVYHDHIPIRESDLLSPPNQSRCQVYTLGTRSWRSIAPSVPLKYGRNTIGAHLNGNLHWLASDVDKALWISCFDLENELFTSFSSPRLGNDHDLKSLSALGGCLCVCDNSGDDEIVIWLMKKYGDGKSWTREFIIRKGYIGFYGVLFPIKVFKDGDILIAMEGFYDARLLCYSGKTNTIQGTDLIPSNVHIRTRAVSYTPSFLTLKTFVNEYVSSF